MTCRHLIACPLVKGLTAVLPPPIMPLTWRSYQNTHWGTTVWAAQIGLVALLGM